MKNPLKNLNIKNHWQNIKYYIADIKDDIGDRMPEFMSKVPRGAWIALFVLFILFPVLYYPVAAWLFYYRVGNDVTWAVPERFIPEGGSNTVGTLAALMDREVTDNHWTPNDPIWVPSAMLDDPQNYQKGMQQAAGRMALALSDFIGKNRGSSSFNPDLVAARSGLNYNPERWIMSSESDTLVTESAESMYGTAIEKLMKYNADLANPNVQVWYTLRADNLRDTLALISTDLGDASVMLADQIEEGIGGWIDPKADDVFFQVQGRIYVYYMSLKALEKDFAEVLKVKQADQTWTKMMGYLRKAVEINPLIIANGNEESLICPNHLNNQSARMQLAARSLNEIRDILDR